MYKYIACMHVHVRIKFNFSDHRGEYGSVIINVT